MISRVAFVLGSLVSVAAVASFASACSSKSSGGGTTPPVDSGTMQSDDSGIADAGADSCGSSPSIHAGEADGGIYCPFGPENEAGTEQTTLYCGSGGSPAKLCCIGGELASGSYPPSNCAASCSFQATSGNTTIQCEDPNTDCPSGNICCGGAEKTIEQVEGCGYYKLSDWVYTKCESAKTCAASATAPATGAEFQVCASQAECPSGKTCTPFKAKGIDLGFCM
jgi:hypothetical protein